MGAQSATRPEANPVTAAWRSLSKPVFLPALAIIIAALAFATWYGSVYGTDAQDAFTELRDGIGRTIGWWYVLLVTVFVVFAFWVACSRAGAIRLGRDDERPVFSRFAWFAMLFSAGMGIGLVFWGVAEPLTHMMSPPEIAGVEPGSAEAGRFAIGAALFHWGLHAWAIYAVVGLGLAYMSFRRGRPLSIRWLLEPVFGRKLIESWAGHAIDVFAIVGTVFGVATSLGQGVLQMQAGLAHLGWFQPSKGLLLVLVVIVTVAGTISVVTGLDKGVRWLSNANMSLAALLALAVLLIGPTAFLFQSFVQNSGEYLQTLPKLALVTGAGADDGWTLGWTLFNQAWFLSWAPFVGMFIARISRGRTIREFVFGVMLAPTLIAVVWFTVFGSTGILEQLKNGSMVGEGGSVDTNTTLFTLFEQLTGGSGMAVALSVVALLVITLFFVTSSDSCALVIDVLSHGGSTETPRTTRVFWAVMIGVAGALLLLAGGEAALTVLQVSSIASAAPLSVVYALAVVAMIRMFRHEIAIMPRFVRVHPKATPTALVSAAREKARGEDTRGGAAPGQEDLERDLRALLRAWRDGDGAGGTAGAGETAGAGGTGDAEGTATRRRPAATPPGAPSPAPAATAVLEQSAGALAPSAALAAVGASPDRPVRVLTVLDVPAYATTVDTATGAVEWDETAMPGDPIEGEVFDTPEFASSAAGVEERTARLLRGAADGDGPAG
ncbi:MULTISPECIES: BCCT family transporter [unclassified Streptomyces]|uniref:BCCT family transporter n=1 Tax=unclassified Streptomyces TaxID=2593676 RepID=UPI00332B00FF